MLTKKKLVMFTAIASISATPQALEIDTISISQVDASSWNSVSFDEPFSSPPIVVMGDPSYNGTHAGTFRIKDITNTGFDFKFDEWNYLDGFHIAEQATYIAIEEGSHDFGGLQIVAGSTNAQGNWVTVNYGEDFNAIPLVFTRQVSNRGSDATTTRVRNVAHSSFQVLLQEEEANDGEHALEEIHYIAIEKGSGTTEGRTVLTGATADHVTDAWYSIDFSAQLDTPHLFVGMQKTDGTDTANTRYRNLTSSGVQVHIDEEQSLDPEVTHTSESVAWMLIGESIAESEALYLQHIDSDLYYGLNSSQQLSRTASTTSSAQGLEKVAKAGGFVLRAVGGDMDGMYAYEPPGEHRQEISADYLQAEVFYQHSCELDVIYLSSSTTGGTVKNESDNLLGNQSSGDCGSAANRFRWVGASIYPTPTPGNQLVPSQITDSDLWDLEGQDPDPLYNPYTLRFAPLEAKVTTENGNGWRHEYKIDTSERIPMPEYFEYFKASITVELSDGGKTIVAQYHAEDLSTLMKLYIADSSESGIGDSNPGDGVFGVYVRMLDKDSGEEVKQALGTIRSGDSFTFESINNYGFVTVSALGQSLSTEVEDGGESYLKFGNYLQSQYPDGNENCGTKGDSDSFANCYDEIGINTALVWMKDISYERRD